MERENGVIKRTSSRGGGGSDIGNISISTASTTSTAESSNTITTRRHQEEQFYEDAPQRSFSRTCVLGCEVNKLALCRFPVHDPKRCQNWLKFFNITKDRVERLGGLNNLRVCLKHFNQKQQMAKTRIKTTPTRLQKDALAQASTTTVAASTTIKAATTIILETTKYNNITNKAHDIKHQATNGLQLTRTQTTNINTNSNSKSNGNSSTIIVAAPKRTTSVSSATSTLSRTSDTPSDADGVTIKPMPPAAPSTPPIPPMPATSIPTISTIQLKSCASSSTSTSANANVSNIAVKVPIPNNTNGFINKLSSNGKRKIYLITEKSENNLSSTSDTLNANSNGSTGISKRKMYLIMEDQNGNSGIGNSTSSNNSTGNSCDIHSNGNGLTTKGNLCQAQTENKRKKLTLFADSDTELTTHKFEQILPEILNRIKSQQSVAPQINESNHNNNNNNKGCGSINDRSSDKNIIDIGTEIKLVEQTKPRDEVKVPITLPPKKNRTKITQNIYDNEVISNVPVIVSNTRTIVNVTSSEPISVLSPSNHSAVAGAGAGAGFGDVGGDGTTICNKWEQIYNDKQINLSSDFLFLMKMLPKLESIPEPQKQQVKSCIETFINQSASRCAGQGLY